MFLRPADAFRLGLRCAAASKSQPLFVVQFKSYPCNSGTLPGRALAKEIQPLVACSVVVAILAGCVPGSCTL